jgi:integrase
MSTKGDGCVIQRGNTWTVILSRTDRATGKRSRDYHSGFKTEREAKAALRKLLVAKDEGKYAAPHKGTVEDYIKNWLDKWAIHTAQAGTIERYEGAVSQIIAALGKIPIQKVTAEDINSVIVKLRKEYKPATVKLIYRVAKRIWTHAYKHGHIKRDIFALLDAPSVPRQEVEVLKDEEAARMLDALRGTHLYPLAVLGLTTGMRRGEMLALRWSAVDLDRGEALVRASLEQTRAGLRFKETKTARARTIALPPTTIAVLREHRRGQLELRMKLGLGKQPDDALVFSDHEGNPLPPNRTSMQFIEMMRRIDLPRIGLHDLRHYHASTLIAAGEDIITVSRRLGHANASITLNVYGHVMKTQDRASAIAESKIGSIFGSKAT